jgi:nucleotide-binding universal stress UspA family protein
MNSIPKKILVATDFSATADRAEKLAFALASLLEAELHLVHVRVILEDPLMAEERQMEIERLLSAADETTRHAFAKGRIGRPGLTVKTHLIRGVSAAEGIVATASELDCDLVIMGTHGRRGIKHMLLGSVAENVVRSARRPVLTVRPGTDLPAQGPANPRRP